MARYIDADVLYGKLYPLDLVDKKLYTINAKAVADAIAKTPTADVAPRSEVERLQMELDVMRGVANSFKMHYENAKTEAAKEIFEELGEYTSDFAAGYIDGDQFLQEFYRLRARYTGEVGMLSD